MRRVRQRRPGSAEQDRRGHGKRLDARASGFLAYALRSDLHHQAKKEPDHNRCKRGKMRRSVVARDSSIGVGVPKTLGPLTPRPVTLIHTQKVGIKYKKPLSVIRTLKPVGVN